MVKSGALILHHVRTKDDVTKESFSPAEESGPDVSEGSYGKYPLNQSQHKLERELISIKVSWLKWLTFPLLLMVSSLLMVWIPSAVAGGDS